MARGVLGVLVAGLSVMPDAAAAASVWSVPAVAALSSPALAASSAAGRWRGAGASRSSGRCRSGRSPLSGGRGTSVACTGLRPPCPRWVMNRGPSGTPPRRRPGPALPGEPALAGPLSSPSCVAKPGDQTDQESGMRWITVGPSDRPGTSIVLEPSAADPGIPMTSAAASSRWPAAATGTTRRSSGRGTRRSASATRRTSTTAPCGRPPSH